MSGTIERRIRERIEVDFAPSHLEVVNESSGHNVPSGSESHFKLVVVSDAFEGASRVDRHRRVYACLAEELRSGVHALALHLFTTGEWADRQDIHDSPPCLGGGRGR